MTFVTNRVQLLAVCLASATVAVTGTRADAQQQATAGFDHAIRESFRAEQAYAAGYVTVGFYSRIMTVPDRPFTAKRTYTYTAADQNGKLQPAMEAQTGTFTVARDHLGRIHYEFAGSRSGPVAVTIVDPVDHRVLRYETASIGVAHGVAQECTQPLMSEISRPTTSSERAVAALNEPAKPAEPLPSPMHEELGSREIEGIHAVGQRTSNWFSLPDGRPSAITAEEWFSPELGLTLVDVQANEQWLRELRTHDVVPGEPDPALFRLPAGYVLAADLPSCVPRMP